LVEDVINDFLDDLEDLVKVCSEIYDKMKSENEEHSEKHFFSTFNVSLRYDLLINSLDVINYKSYREMWLVVEKHLLSLPLRDRETFIRVHFENRFELIKNDFFRFSEIYFSFDKLDNFNPKKKKLILNTGSTVEFLDYLISVIHLRVSLIKKEHSTGKKSNNVKEISQDQTFPREENDKPTTKQQLLILYYLGLLDSNLGLGTNQLSRFLGILLNRNSQNVKTALIGKDLQRCKTVENLTYLRDLFEQFKIDNSKIVVDLIEVEKKEKK